jgi:hypothetical protein
MRPLEDAGGGRCEVEELFLPLDALDPGRHRPDRQARQIGRATSGRSVSLTLGDARRKSATRSR